MASDKQQIQGTVSIKNEKFHVMMNVLGVVLFFLGEVVAKLVDAQIWDSGPRFAAYSKVILLLYFLFMIVKNRVIPKAWLLLVVSFVITQFVFKDFTSYNFKEELTQGNIYYFIRYSYMPIFLYYLIGMKELCPKIVKALVQSLEWLLYLNIACMLLGWAFDLNIFKSYTFTPRFGYCGVFLHPGDLSYMLMVYIVLQFYKWIGVRDTVNLIKLLVVLAATFLIGTKSILLFNVVLFLVYLCCYTRYKKAFRIVTLLGVVSLVIGLQKIVDFFIEIFPFWKPFRDQRGILTVLSSGRNELFLSGINYIKTEWNIANFIFGGSNLKSFNAHSEILDLYLFMGLPGLCFFVYLFKNHIFSGVEGMRLVLLVIILMMSLITGNLLFSVLPALYYAIGAIYFSDNKNTVESRL